MVLIIKSRTNRLFLLTSVFILTLFLLLSIKGNTCAEENKISRVSMGAGAFFGRSDVITRGDSEENWKGGYGYGGGLIFERMLNNRFGVHSGMWYGQYSIKIESDKDDYSMEARSLMFNIPLYLIISFNFNKFGTDLLTGFNFAYITETYIYEGSRGDGRSTNARSYVYNYQFGLGGGVKLRYRVTRFIDIFIAGLGERYLTAFIEADEGTQQYIYNIKLQSGVLLRTF